MTVPSEQKVGRASRAAALLTTNMIKIGGLGAAMNELFIRPSARTSVIALAAFMMAGAQLSEQAVLAALDRIMGGGEGESSEKREERPKP